MKNIFTSKFQENLETGLTQIYINKKSRQVRPDGTFNVTKSGLSFGDSFSLYHTLISIGWLSFFFWVVVIYLSVNFIFAFAYYAIGINELHGMLSGSGLMRFQEAFFFSAQTLTTVGYGRINPIGIVANSLASFEALVGLLMFALATGLMFARFSKPRLSLIFSKNLLVSPYLKNETGLMFRFSNKKLTDLIDVEVQVSVSYLEEVNQRMIRKFFSLPLEQSKISALVLSWTVVHPIDDKSPLFQFRKNEYEEREVEFIINIKAFDNTFGQSVHLRKSYIYSEMIWGAKFIPIYTASESQKTTILHLENIDKFDSAEVNLPVLLDEV